MLDQVQDCFPFLDLWRLFTGDTAKEVFQVLIQVTIFVQRIDQAIGHGAISI